jgi:hypothetical protein
MTNDMLTTATREVSLWTGWIQLGFAGLCLVLIFVGVMAGRALAKVLWSLNASVTANTEVTRSLGDHLTVLSSNVNSLTGTVGQVRDVVSHCAAIMPRAPVGASLTTTKKGIQYD